MIWLRVGYGYISRYRLVQRERLALAKREMLFTVGRARWSSGIRAVLGYRVVLLCDLMLVSLMKAAWGALIYVCQ